MNYVITTLQALLFVVYTGYIWRRFGVLTSISSSTYALEGNQRYLFFGWLTALAILNWFQGMATWGDLMSLGLVITGLTLEYAKGHTLEDEIHTISTILAIVAGLFGLWFMYGIWIPIVIMAAGTAILYKATYYWIWWVECLAFVLVLTGYYIR